MAGIEIYALDGAEPRPLPVPATATGIHDLYDNYPLGAYTSLCTFEHNKFLYLGAHLDRLQQSADLLQLDYDIDQPALRRALHRLCSAYSGADCRVRLDVLARPIEMAAAQCRLLVALAPFNPPGEHLYRQGVTVDLAPRLKRRQPAAKTAAFVVERRSHLNSNGDVYEHLLLDERGYILEGATSNFFGVRDGVLWTAGEGVLAGIARRLVLEQAEVRAVPVRLEAVHIDDVPALDEAALSSSSRAIMPIVNIAGQAVADGRPGPIIRQLLAAYREFLARAIAPAIIE